MGLKPHAVRAPPGYQRLVNTGCPHHKFAIKPSPFGSITITAFGPFGVYRIASRTVIHVLSPVEAPRKLHAFRRTLNG